MKVVLADDEPIHLYNLENKLNQIDDIEIIGKFDRLDFQTDASLLIKTDVLFLDIEVPGMNGLAFAEQLLENYPNLSVVFVTAFDKYAVNAFDLNVLDYLVKPVQLERLRRTVNRARNMTKRASEKDQMNLDTMRINVCNELTFQTGEKIQQPRWRTSKAKELFLYLLQNRQQTVEKSELVKLIWPDLSSKKAYSQMYTAIYHIRKTIESFKMNIGIAGQQGGYRLWTYNISIDMALWEGYLEALPAVSSEILQRYEASMKLYTGPYLGNHHYAWIDQERHRLEQRWLTIAKQMAKTYEENKQFEPAVDWYVGVVSYCPEDEEAQFALMQVYAMLGYGVLVSAQYKQLQKAMDDLDIEVDPDIVDWYETWRQQETLKIYA